MNPYLQSVLLGIVEGLTEFLPVSSTAHLRIAEALMKIPLDDAYWKMYTIVIQLGAIFALTLLFLSRIVEFLRTFPRGENGDRTWLNHPISLTLIAFAVTSVPSLLLHKWSEKNLGSITAMAIALLVGGIVMWVIDYWADQRDPDVTEVEQMTLFQAVWIGLCQTLSAVFPGTSRSMSTIAAGQLVSLDRPTALTFSFLLSIPTMFAATVLGFPEGDSSFENRDCRRPGAARGDEQRTLVRARSSDWSSHSSWLWAWSSGFCNGSDGTASRSSRCTVFCLVSRCWSLARDSSDRRSPERLLRLHRPGSIYA